MIRVTIMNERDVNNSVLCRAANSEGQSVCVCIVCVSRTITTSELTSVIRVTLFIQ